MQDQLAFESAFFYQIDINDKKTGNSDYFASLRWHSAAYFLPE